jgi:hypothetical protein
VRAALLAGADGAVVSEEVQISYLGFAADIELARSLDASCVIRSTTGAAGFVGLAGSYYRLHSIQTFMPAGSNSPGEIFESNGGTNLPIIVIAGAGDEGNETGDDIEFFSPDPITVEPDLSSYSNGYIAGQLFKIKSVLDCTWWEARYRARMTASRNNIWHEVDGYGLIDISAAVNYSGEIASDPYQSIGPVGALSANQNQSTVTLTTTPVVNATGYIFEMNTGSGWNIVQSNSLTSCSQFLSPNVETLFRVKAFNESEETSYSNTVAAVWSVPEPEPPPPTIPPPVENNRIRSSIGFRKFV